MKNNIYALFLASVFCLGTLYTYSQCDPATPEECPDPENNGQVCPDSLPVAFINQSYSQVATIKPPAVFVMEDGTEITLHHVKLQEVSNLPVGITWQSNTTDSVFIAGEYYCVLMEGNPVTAGEYPLRIVVDVYVIVIPGFPPVKVATAVDSTSLTMIVVDDTGIKDKFNDSFFVRQNNPNPFKTETRIDYYSEKTGPVTFEVYNLLGKRIHVETIMASGGENTMVFNGELLPKGSYFYVLRFGGYQSTGMMIRAD
jgi:hypothetical protein